MSLRLSRLRAARGGAAAMEFALIVPLLMLLIFATIEFGRLLWTRDVVKQVAVEGARCMGTLAPGCSTTGIVYSASKTKDYIVARAVGFSVPLTTAGVTIDRANSCASPAGQSTSSQVTISYTFNSAVGSFIAALADPRLLTVSACFPNQS